VQLLQLLNRKQDADTAQKRGLDAAR
jgi:hypothetical protein